MTFMEVIRNPLLPKEGPMTTDYVTHFDRAAVRIPRPSRDVVEAAIGAVAYVLWLPGAALLMSVLTA